MKESISAYLKTEPDSLKDHLPSKFRQNIIFSNQRIVNGKKVTYLNIKKQSPQNQKDAWKQIFGNFLHDINLKQKKKGFSSEAKEHLQDPLVNEISILLPRTNKQFKLVFYKYLEGEQSIQQLMEVINFPHVHAKQVEDSKSLQRKLSIVQKIKKFKNHGYTKTNDSTPLLDINSSTRQLKAHQIRMVDQRRFTEAGKLLDIFKTKINKKIQVLKDFFQQRVLVKSKFIFQFEKIFKQRTKRRRYQKYSFYQDFL
ncbi:unnamed protein product [Paramecium octaurelia]|uniref:Uncharacterized protein n=1 Tax=Paramecium octaurelia TaxID=43137 RepID=A0A8S1SAZ8_PAROT|nr:unnamed protein product [Paramecium octaurelia]